MYAKLLFLMILVSLLLGCEEDPLIARQVKAVPPSVPNNLLLNVDKHISLTPRPKEHFAFPIGLGEVGPADSLYSGKRQYPFFCMTLDAGLGQPLVDNQQGYGVPVYDEQNKIIGYSQDCLIKTRLDYYYLSEQDRQVKPYDKSAPPKLSEIATTKIDGKIVPQIYRLERGTINRYIYHIAMLVPLAQMTQRLNKDYWNNKLIYQFHGGASIGFRQGRLGPERFIDRRIDQLSQGYALISSSGNDTSYGYNLLLGEDTARRVKQQFISLYGEPLYTLGIGGSGGALAQYLIAQNSTGILDGLMPIYSYPDMVSQSIYILDCDLLHHYFNVKAQDNSRWRDWEQREKVEGMNGINDFEHPYEFLLPLNQIFAGAWPNMPGGSSECVYSWFFSATFFYNPKQGFLKPYFSDSVQSQTNWTYWQDLAQIYGTDDKGFARTTWGNEGVQYGLRPLLNQELTIEEFLHLNRNIGAWQPQEKMQKEKVFNLFGMNLPLWLSLWSRNNITPAEPYSAKRKFADLKAIEQGYRFGQVFIGKADVPILEIRHYLEESLNMHHTSASFEARLRMQDFQGHSDNQILWIADENYIPITEGLALMDKWLMARRDKAELPASASKPVELQDACIDANGKVLHQGDNVWNGDWNQQPNGECTKVFPPYSTPRIQAGGPWAGSIFQCGLIPVEHAIEIGLYGELNMKAHLTELKRIFPHGVCDYSLGDIGRPDLGFKNYKEKWVNR